MRGTRIAVFAACSVFAASMACPPAAGQDAGPAAQAALEAARAEHGVPGMAAAVWRADGIVWAGAVGSADLELDAPVTDLTRFRLGSVAKVFTASLAARLAEQGRVDLDRPLGEWMPGLPEHYQGVTLRHLLGHLGGVRHYAGKDFNPFAPGGSIDMRWYPTTESALALFIDDPPVGAPGEKVSYSTFGYTLVSAALESATGETFEALLHTDVFEPLGLGSVAVDHFRAIVPGRATPYDTPNRRLNEEGDGPRNALPMNSAYKVAAGGLVATASDVARFGAAHFAPGFLGEAAFAQAFTAQADGAREPTGVGLGWRIGRDSAGRQIYHHSGSQQGCRATLIVYPDQRVAVAVLGNLTGTPQDITGIAAQIAALFLNDAGAP